MKGRKKYAVARKILGSHRSSSTISAPSGKLNSVQMVPMKRLGFQFLLEDVRARKSIVPNLTMKISQTNGKFMSFP